MYYSSGLPASPTNDEFRSMTDIFVTAGMDSAVVQRFLSDPLFQEKVLEQFGLKPWADIIDLSGSFNQSRVNEYVDHLFEKQRGRLYHAWHGHWGGSSSGDILRLERTLEHRCNHYKQSQVFRTLLYDVLTPTRRAVLVLVHGFSQRYGLLSEQETVQRLSLSGVSAVRGAKSGATMNFHAKFRSELVEGTSLSPNQY